MSRKRDDLACAEAILAVSSRLLTHWELHSDAIWALPLNAAGTGNVPNLKPISRHRTRSSCKDTRYGNNVRALSRSVVRPILDLIACLRIKINIDIDIFNAANETPLQMILYNCITLRLGGGRPTAANLREVKDILVPLLRQQLVHEVKFPQSQLLALLKPKFLGILLPKLRDLKESRFQGDATIEEIASFSDDDYFRCAGQFLWSTSSISSQIRLLI